MEDSGAPPIRLMNFVSQEQLDESKKLRGPRIEDGTAQRDRPLYEILRENKDKKDAEFNERFKHRPPKALDEDETEFLDSLEMSRREYEKQLANEEALELQRFQAAVEAKTAAIFEPKPITPVLKVQTGDVKGEKLPKRKNSSPLPSGIVIKAKIQPKKAKMEPTTNPEATTRVNEAPSSDELKTQSSTHVGDGARTGSESVPVVNSIGGLVLYSDESEDDE